MTWAPDYITLNGVGGLKDYLHIDDTDTADDGWLAGLITTASQDVNDYCGRQFGTAAPATSFTYTATYDRHLGKWTAEIDDLRSSTGLTVTLAGAAVASTGWSLQPVNALAKGRPYERIYLTAGPTLPYFPVGVAALDNLVLTSDSFGGWAAVPDPIKVATKLQSGRLAIRRDSPYGMAGSGDQGAGDGQVMRLSSSYDVDFRSTLGSKWRRVWAAR